MRKRSLLIPVFIVSLFMTFSCEKQDKGVSFTKIEKKSLPKVCLALGYSGPGDGSFNDMQYNGLIEASHRYPISISYSAPNEDTEAAVQRLLEDLISRENCSLMITSGYLAVKPIALVAKKNPGIFFALLDEIAEKLPNLISVVFSEQEGSFLTGYLAAKMTRTGKVGFLGGVNIPSVKNFLWGFEQGIQYASSKTRLKTVYISKIPDFSGFTNPKKGFEEALKLYNQGYDIIYAVSGATGNGIIQAALEKKRWVIGVDSNQDHMAPGYVLTSMMKRLDQAVIDLCYHFTREELKGARILELDLAHGGVSLTPMKYTRQIIPVPLQKELEEIQNLIRSGKIKVQNRRNES